MFGRLFKRQVCGKCEALQKMVDYQQRMIDRLLLERNLPPIKDKKLKIEDEVEHIAEDIQGEVYGA